MSPSPGTPAATPPTAAPVAAPRAAMAGSILAMILGALDQNIVNTALPSMVRDLGGLAHMSWVVTAFMLTSTATTTSYGRLSDVYGRRRLFFLAVVLFLAGSLLCGVAGTMLQLILFRALQGLGAGGLMVLAQSAIGDVVSPRERPRYQGFITGAFALASVAGPLLGGGLTQFLSWRWVFYVNLPVGLLALVLIGIGLGPSERRADARAMDAPGVLLLAAGTTVILLFLAWWGVEFPWLSPQAAGFVLAIAIFAGLFVRREKATAEPVVQLGLFRNRVYCLSVWAGGMLSFAMMSSVVFLPLYFQWVLGMEPAIAGAMLLPQVAGMMVTSIIGGHIVARLGRNRTFLLAGTGLEGLAFLSMAGFSQISAPAPAFLVSTFMLGLGMGMGMPNLTVTAQNAVPYRDLGAATGLMTYIRSLGAALGVATAGAVMSQFLVATLPGVTARGLSDALADLTPERLAQVTDAYHVALTVCFLVSGVVMAGTVAALLGLPDRRLSDRIER